MQVESLECELSPPRLSLHRGVRAFACATFISLIGALLLLRPPCPDLATFDYAGWIVTQGGTPYVDVIEQNWPGAIWLHALSTALFGNHVWSFRILDLALLLLGSYALFQLAREGARPATRWIVVALYQVLYVTGNEWLVGQRDVLTAHLMLALGLLHVRRVSGGSPVLPAVVGAAMALATLTRPTHLAYLPLLFLADRLLAARNGRSMRTSLLDAARAGGAFALVLGVVALWGHATGALAGWYEAAVLFNARLYSHTASAEDLLRSMIEMTHGYRWVCLLALAGTVSWLRRGERNVLAAMAALALTGLISFVAQGKAFGYHFGPVYPVVTLLAAECIAWTIDLARARGGRLAPALAGTLCLLAVLSGAKKVHRTLRPQLAYLVGLESRESMARETPVGLAVSSQALGEVAQYVRDHTTPDQTVLVWGRTILINYLAERRLPTAVATVGVLDFVSEEGAPLHEHFLAFERALAHAPPAMLVAFNERVPEEHAALFGARANAKASALVRTLLAERYRLAERFGPLDVYALE